MNDWQRQRFTEKMIKTMFDTVSGKNIALLGFAFKKDTGDTRESSTITIAAQLLEEGAVLKIYDPKVTLAQMKLDLDMACSERTRALIEKNVVYCKSAFEACDGAHAFAVLTEWDEFVSLDYKAIYDKMQKPAFAFDGRLILNNKKLADIGFDVYTIGHSHLKATAKESEFFFNQATA